MGRIIINNNSSAGDDVAVALVLDVVNEGRISNNGKQYCYCTKYSINGFKLMVIPSINKGSDSFQITDAEQS